MPPPCGEVANFPWFSTKGQKFTILDKDAQVIGRPGVCQPFPLRAHDRRKIRYMACGDAVSMLAVNRSAMPEIGRESCRERVCQYVYISVVAVSLKKQTKQFSSLIIINTRSRFKQ